MPKPYPLSVLLVMSVLLYYGTGYVLGVVLILSNILFWGQYNFFGYVMPFYPFLAGFMIARTTGKHRKGRFGIAFAILLPLFFAYLEVNHFHAAFLKVIMHPVPHFKVKFPVVVFYPLLVASSALGYRIGLKRY